MPLLKDDTPRPDPDPAPPGETRRLVDHFFRDQAAELTASLTRAFGPERLELVENAVQEAFIRALETWPFRGRPDNPGAWIRVVARNYIIDQLRRESRLLEKASALSREEERESRLAGTDDRASPLAQLDPLADDTLKMMFLCCHPALPRPGRIALILKTVCGFGIAQIGQALLSRNEAVRKILTRARQKIRQERLPFALPPPAEIDARLDDVLEALYLLFNEGYKAHAGEALIRRELCMEALRVTLRLLRGQATSNAPDADLGRVQALAALMSLQAARLPARSDGEGRLLRLHEQDRSRWDAGLIKQGMFFLDLSRSSRRRSPFHLQAAIAACHVTARDHASTDWERIREFYDDLFAMETSPVIALNRAVAIGMTAGPEAGLAALEEIVERRELRDYHLLPALQADFLHRLGRSDEARERYRRALELVQNLPERRFLRERLDRCDFDYA